MSLVFPFKDNTRYPSENKFETRNIRTVKYGTDTLAHLGPKIWSIIPSDMKKEQTLELFAKRIRQWTPDKCPCTLCKTYVQGVSYIN